MPAMKPSGVVGSRELVRTDCYGSQCHIRGTANSAVDGLTSTAWLYRLVSPVQSAIP